jgi:hypothetical protein
MPGAIRDEQNWGGGLTGTFRHLRGAHLSLKLRERWQ